MLSHCSRKDRTFASEALLKPTIPGSFESQKTAEVASWLQQAPSPPSTFSPAQFPPTPESFSDYCQDMYPEFGQEMDPTFDFCPVSVAGQDWSTMPASEERTFMPLQPEMWPTSGYPSIREVPYLDAPTLRTATHGSVASSSPDLSHMGQTQDGLNTFCPDLECPVPSEDSFYLFDESDPWNLIGLVPSEPYLPQDSDLSLLDGTSSDSANACYTDLSSAAYVAQESMLPNPEAQACDSRRSMSEPSVTHGRRLLPRTQAHPLSRSQSSSQYRVLQPHMPIAMQSASNCTVSNTSEFSRGPYMPGSVLDPSMVAPQTWSNAPLYAPGSGYTGSTVTGVHSVAPVLPPHHSYYGSYAQAVPHAQSHMMYNASQPLLLDIAQPRLLRRDTATHLSSALPSSTTEGDEGRYRTDPLYKVAAKNGLYHCPYANQPSACSHKPTKLKCNYDKYIDSHLKPFKCKDAGCSKQKFSSMACVLRHEREAHGLHGHGDRPFVCQYADCDRSQPRNGFPRKYNLNDHMRRMHDWKDPNESAEDQEKGTATAQGARKAAARKRKASTENPAEPTFRKVKHERAV